MREGKEGEMGIRGEENGDKGRRVREKERETERAIPCILFLRLMSSYWREEDGEERWRKEGREEREGERERAHAFSL